MIPYILLKIRRGTLATLPVLSDGELGFAEDVGQLFAGTPSGNVNISNFYATGTPASWNGAPPTTISSAIDRIAAAVAALRGSPIP